MEGFHMEIEIRFMDRLGKLRCSLSAGFISCEAASRYALEVMKTRMCRHYTVAEICPLDSAFPIVVAHNRNPHFVDLRGQLRRRQDAEKIVSLAAALKEKRARKHHPAALGLG